MTGTWRDVARPIIRKVVERVGLEDRKALKKALKEAYPWGERKYHPYKIWCDEIHIQLGLREFGKKKEIKFYEY